MITVATVLKTGGDFLAQHAHALRDGVLRHGAGGCRFVCHSDDPVVPDRIPLVHDWPGWWSKLEAFRPGVHSGPVILLDLDTVVVGDLSSVFAAAERPGWMALACPYGRPYFGTGVMSWHGDDLAHVYTHHAEKAERLQGRFRGDQEYMLDLVRRGKLSRPRVWQDELPGELRSYKADVMRSGGRIPPGTRVLYFHGNPRPWKVPLEKMLEAFTCE